MALQSQKSCSFTVLTLLFCFSFLFLPLSVVWASPQDGEVESVKQKSVKKDLNLKKGEVPLVPAIPPQQAAQPESKLTAPAPVPPADAPAPLPLADAPAPVPLADAPAVEHPQADGAVVVISEKTLTELQQEKKKAADAAEATQKHYYHEEEVEDIPDSLRMGFYFFLLLSTSAVAFILFKVYRLRLSRAERKYGVQGDRSNQELTPLPISIDDGNSDEDDQTLFDQTINRQQIRIL